MKLSTWGTIVLTPMILLAFGFLMCNLIPSDIDDKAKELEAYCCRNGYNTDYAILVDAFDKRYALENRVVIYIVALLHKFERYFVLVFLTPLYEP